MEVTFTECRFLNLSVVTKGLDDDCNKAESSLTFKDLIQSQYSLFNIIKSDKCDNVKRIKAVKLYPGMMVGSHDKAGYKCDVVGGI